MKLAKRPIDPNLNHYFVRIEVVSEANDGTFEAFNKKVAATSIEQAIRKAGMQAVQEVIRTQKTARTKI